MEQGVCHDASQSALNCSSAAHNTSASASPSYADMQPWPSSPKQSPSGASDVANSDADVKQDIIDDLLGDLLTQELEKPMNAQELKRTRNRECMRRTRRRTRRRKHEQLNELKQRVADMERHLEQLHMKQREAMDAMDSAPHASLRKLFDSLQDENNQLRETLRDKELLRDAIAPLLEQEEQRKAIDKQERLQDAFSHDQFEWLRYVSPILRLKTMTTDDLKTLIHESCAQILASARHADVSIPDPNQVLGWTDKRIVASERVYFLFSKDFAHQDGMEAEQKSWETSTNLEKIVAIPPRSQPMMVLHRWGDEAVVLARTLNVTSMNDDGGKVVYNFCTVFLVFPLKTPDGYIVGSRTLAPEQIREALAAVGERRVVYIDLWYALHFTRLSPGSDVGCNVRFGGHAGNGTNVYAKVSAIDALMAALRWENHCVGPLNRLTVTSLS